MESSEDISPSNREGTEPFHEAPPPQTPLGATAQGVPAADFPAAAVPAPPRTARRRWWLAALLSLFAAPAGQVYNGQARKGVLIVVCFDVLSFVACVLTIVHLPLWMLALLLVAALALNVYLLIDAIVQAVHAGTTYRLRRYNRWFVYLLLIVVAQITPRLFIRGVRQVVQTFKIPSASNEPTVLVGDHLFVDAWSYRFVPPKRGELVVFRSREGPYTVLKRVVALGGDRVEIRDKRLIVNDRALVEPYAVHRDPQTYPDVRSVRDNLPAQTVPEGSVFVLGDNRDNSWDSRFYGPIRQDAIVGGRRVRIYWSWDSDRHVTRWERVGRFLQ